MPKLQADSVLHVTHSREENGNIVKSTIILAKTVIGAGIAAIPLTNALLGWPLALAFLLLMAYTTYATLNILVRAITSENSSSYPEVTRKLLGRWAGLLLEIAIVAFGVGLMLVYCVVIGDMLVGKEGYAGLLCGWLGGIFCNRPLVVGLVALLALIPAVSFRKMQSLAFASWIGMGSLGIWAVGTLVLLVAAIAGNLVQPVRLTPDRELLGGSGIRLVANICAVIPVLTTAYSCQAAAPFVMAELRPKTEKRMRTTSLAAVGITTLIYALIAVGSYLVFGRGTQSDVLHNYTPATLSPLVPCWLADTLYVVVRLSFLLGVLTLFPLMMFPARDGLVRIVSGRTAPLSTIPFFLVTYGICIFVYAVSVVTPSIWGPMQIIGATAGAVIGFIIPGLLALREPVDGAEEEVLLGMETTTRQRWNLKHPLGWALLSLGLLQMVTGIVAQTLSSKT